MNNPAVSTKSFSVFIILFLLFFVCSFVFVFKSFKHTFREDTSKATAFLLNAQARVSEKWPQIPTQAQHVLSAQTVSSELDELPKSFQLSVTPRRQRFNLSCEFSTASTIIYYFTKNPEFSVSNSLQAEKQLMSYVEAAQNPNIGVRMGESAIGDDKSLLYRNLNAGFGGVEYYGVHAPPFIDIFSRYGLVARPVFLSENLSLHIKDSLVSGHLFMAWLHSGFGKPIRQAQGKPIDVELSYGISVPLIKGEHTVVVYGYDESGFLVMDPAIAATRHISEKTFLEAIQLYSIPLLEVYPTQNEKELHGSVPTMPIDTMSGLDRRNITVSVENSSSKVAAGNMMVSLLRDFGYHVVSSIDSTSYDGTDVSVSIKKESLDVLPILKKDLSLATYKIASVSSEIIATESADIMIRIGE